MTRQGLAKMIGRALRLGQSLVWMPIEDAISLQATLDYAEDLIHDLQWVCLPTDDQELWLCPDCKAWRINGHHDDCGLDAIIHRMEGRAAA